eukprot:c18948_g1_i1.p1 GENE.c18948_g1_i1~~c18948_g1_i1.p1  ORF type:complete len:327 (-),score=125.94 c18948_g1_i1:64-1044(-)
MAHKTLLESMKLGEFINSLKTKNPNQNRSLQYVTKNNQIRDAVKKLSDNRILSLPVWDEEAKKFVGFISIIDIVNFCMEDGERMQKRGRSSPRAPQEMFSDLLSEITLDGSQFDVLESDSNLEEVLRYFTLGWHRVLVADPSAAENTPSGFVISQSDVLNFLHENSNQVESIVTKTLQEHGFLSHDAPSIGPKKLITLSHKASAVQGFRTLYNDHTNAVAVVDENGKLVDNLSATDLRGIPEESILSLLTLPVLTFLEHVRKVVRQPITCTKRSTLKEVIDILVERRIHRVWIVDDLFHVEGVVSLTDVICKFAPFDYKKLHSFKV